MKVKHTPQLWRVKKWPDKNCTDGFRYVITDSRGHGLFRALTAGNHQITRANAIHIVDCVNGREE